MKPCVFFVKKESDGTVITTPDEISKMISLAYEQGVEDGKKQNYFSITPNRAVETLYTTTSGVITENADSN